MTRSWIVATSVDDLRSVPSQNYLCAGPSFLEIGQTHGEIGGSDRRAPTTMAAFGRTI
jgi:hypothetical protein